MSVSKSAWRSSASRIAIVSAIGLLSLGAGSAGAAEVSGTSNTAILLDNNNANLSVTSTGVLSTTAPRSVTWGASTSGSVIDNHGSIIDTAATKRAIGSNGTVAGSLTLNNYAGAIIQSDDDAVRIETTLNGATATINNAGSIHSAVGQAVDFDSATAGKVIINNELGGLISAGVGSDVIRPGENAKITNYGTIQSDADSTTFKGDGIDFQANDGGSVDNYGLIEGSKHGITGDLGATVVNEVGGVIRGRNGSGINYDTLSTDPAVSVTNYGLISGEAQLSTGSDSDDIDGDGVDIDGLVKIYNYGTIQALGASGFKDGNPLDRDISDGISVGGGEIYNYAGGVISSVSRGILVDDSNANSAYSATTIYNEGTITSGNGYATITLTGDWADTLINKGSISGDVLMGGGDDQVTLYVGQYIGGMLDGQDGSDALTLDGSGAATLGNVQNFETLDVAGGDWTLDTNQSYFDGATIGSDASLTVAADTTLDAVVTISAGGTLYGNGTVGGIDATAGSTVSPGGDGTIGTLTSTGTVTLTAANFVADVSGDGKSDLLAVQGTVNLDGGNTLVLNGISSAYHSGTTYTVLTADTISGSFASIDDPFLFLDATQANSGTALTVTLDRNDTAFASVAKNGNERAVANALDAAGADSELYSLVLGSTDSEVAEQSLGQLSGEVHASTMATLQQQSTQAGQTILDHLASLGMPAPGASSQPSAALGYADDEKAKPSPAFAALAPAPTVYSGWTQAFGTWQSLGSDGNAAEAKSSVGGGLIGADISNDRYVLGLAGGYSWGSSKIDSQDASADIQTGLLALYGGLAFDALKLRGGASIAWSSIDTSRLATVGDVTEHPHASYDATTTNVFAELAYQAKINGGMVLEPFAALGWSHVDADGFTESNAPVTGLSSGGSTFDTPYTTLGLRAATTLNAGGVLITPKGMVGWRHAFDDVSPDATLAFQNAGASFQTQGAPIARDSFLLQAGADFAVTKNVSVGLSYSGSFGKDTMSNSIQATGEIKF